jgi:hypothetical protein
MRLYRLLHFLVCIPLWLSIPLFGQDSSHRSDNSGALPGKVIAGIERQTEKLRKQINRQSEKYLLKLERREKQLYRTLLRKDSVAARNLFGDITHSYTILRSPQLNTSGIYSARIDSMRTAMNFLQLNNAMSALPAENGKLKMALNSFNNLQDELNAATEIKKYLKDRQQYLRQQLSRFGLAKELRKFEKEVHYYRAQIDEFTRTLEDPSKLEARLLQLARQIPAFKDFFRKNSMLAALFRLPDDDPITAALPIAGLQTRASIQQDMLSRFGSGTDIRSAMQQNIQTAQNQINRLKDKVSQLGSGGSDMDIPSFKVNPQKVKSFWQRIELGANVQSTKSNSFFPVTSDLALTAGYKITGSSVAGIGMSYKLGWGENIRSMKFTHEGIGVRTFIDIKLKGSFYGSGGFEYNYQKPFVSTRQLRTIDSWRQSGLIGVSKLISVQSKWFKKTRVQLLWDFLSYRQIPRTEPLKFRIGYQFQ